MNISDRNVVLITGALSDIGRATAQAFARAGVLVLTKCMAMELAPKIRVNTVTPGFIDTEELREQYQFDDEHNRERYEQDIPLGRLGKPDEIASMILFLVVSGNYITGQNFFVDGGLYMR